MWSGHIRGETADPMAGGHCQCVQCRKTSGTGHGTAMAMPKEAVSVSGEVKIYESKADSGNTVGRAFCPNCGSPVYALNSGFPDLIMMRPSLLDDPSVFQPQMVVWTSRGPAWDMIDESLPRFDKNPDFMPD